MYTIVYQMMLYPINNVRRWMVPLSIITLHNLTGMKHNHQSELQHQCVITQNHVLQMWDEGIQVIRFHPLIGPMSQKFFVKFVGLSPSFETLDSIRNFDHVQEVSLERPMCYLLWYNLAFLVKLFFRTLADSTVLEMAPLFCKLISGSHLGAGITQDPTCLMFAINTVKGLYDDNFRNDI
ncbi:serine/threonine-protein phosphatase PP2A-3 catalytic subunit [Artemisia annua]|uniref:Serine/threonine-protein phosphatase PP2A-3 catalytic subunit n=1 Tax=Artemisia annua TaxID=35608 RepID=A0A2U1MNS2_ARTAN|nr:serine/threonine-protein phosphatase PP2A-3 catalytic subunit [Artemisia annua]